MDIEMTDTSSGRGKRRHVPWVVQLGACLDLTPAVRLFFDSFGADNGGGVSEQAPQALTST